MEWFRLWHDLFDDPKLKRLTKSQKYDLIILLRLASGNATRGQIDLDDEDLAAHLDIHEEEFFKFAAFLIQKDVLERSEQGYLRFVNWAKRQPKSDNVAERVARFRTSRQAVTGSVTECNVTETNRTENNREEQNRTEKSPARGLSSAALTFKVGYPDTSNPTDDDSLGIAWTRHVQPEGLPGEIRVKRELQGWIDSGKWDDPRYVPSMERFLTQPKYRTIPPPRKPQTIEKGWDGKSELPTDAEVLRLLKLQEAHN